MSSDTPVLILSSLEESSNVSRPSVTKTDLPSGAFLLHNVLTGSECDELIRQAEDLGMKELLWTHNMGVVYRQCDRVEADADRVAEHIWSRVIPFLSGAEMDIQPGNDSYGVGTDGVWQPAYLNKRFRLCKYHPGGLFAPHYDGIFVAGEEERSFYTCMVYLNDVPDSGSTNILDESKVSTVFKEYDSVQESAAISQRTALGDDCVLAKNFPERGSCIIFPHMTLHEGAPLKDGVKYIFRTDIVFRRAPGTRRVVVSDSEKEARVLLARGEEFERAHNMEEAVRCYRKAFKLAPQLEGKFVN